MWHGWPRCEGRLSSGALPPPAALLWGAPGSATRLLWLRVCGCGGPTLSPGFHALSGLRAAGLVAAPAPAPLCGALASCGCALWGRRKGVPGGGAFRRCEGRLSSGASPPPVARPLGGLPGPANRVLWARSCECGGPPLFPWLACPVWGCLSRGWWGPSPEVWPSTVARSVWCQALSLPLPPVLWDGRQGFRN